MFNAQYLSQTVRHAVLQYHEVPAARLQIVTTAGLQLAGIPLEALGTREGKKQVISSCSHYRLLLRLCSNPRSAARLTRSRARSVAIPRRCCAAWSPPAPSSRYGQPLCMCLTPPLPLPLFPQFLLTWAPVKLHASSSPVAPVVVAEPA